MKNKIILIMALCLTVSICKAQRKLYDPRMRVTGITEVGKNRLWASNMDFMFVANEVPLTIDPLGSNKVEDVQESLEFQNAGKKILDYLFQYDGHKLSEELLKERAFKDSDLDDQERARVSFLNDRRVIEENYLPILQNNYIYVEKERQWYVFHVQIDKEILDQVFNCWNDIDRYNKIKVPIKKLKKGRIPKKGRSNEEQYRKVRKRVSAFAVRTKVASRNPFLGNVGTLHGVENGHRFLVMRTFAGKEDAQGNVHLYTKKIATARAVDVGRTQSMFHTFAGGSPSAKNADILVFRPDWRISVMTDFLYLPSNETLGWRMMAFFAPNYMRHGWTLYPLTSVGGTFFQFDEDRNGVDSDEADFAQTYFTVGGGLGYSFLRRFELMPYMLTGLDLVTSKDKFPDKKNDDGTYNYKDNTGAFRAIGGARVNVNIFYPLQLTGGAEYFFTVGTHVYNQMTKVYGINKSGLAFFLGLKYNF